MGYEGFIARKQMLRRQHSGFVSLITWISIIGVALGVMALIVVLSVMGGFEKELKSKIVGVHPHLRLEKVGGVENVTADKALIENLNIPTLSTVSPFIEGQAIVRSSKNATGVILKGLDPTFENFDYFQDHLVAGELDLTDRVETQTKRSFLFFKKKIEIRHGSVILGAPLARALRLRIGDEVEIISPTLQSKQLGVSAAQQKFYLTGVFELGMSDFDSALAVVSVHKAQELYQLGERVTGLSLRFSDVDEAQVWKWFIQSKLPRGYRVRSWQDMNASFFQALKVERSVMAILLTLIVLVAAFNIVSTLIMIVLEKTRDIGVLRAIGATRGSIAKIFILEGFWIGFLGVCFGTIAGVLISRHLNGIADFLKQTTGLEVFPSDIYLFDQIPVDLQDGSVAIIATLALGICLFAGFYPAARGARLDPIQALRYE